MQRKKVRIWFLAAAVAASTAWAVTAAAASGTITGKLEASKAKYRRDAVVYIERVAGKQAPPSKPVRMDQRGQKFIPFVLPVLKGTTVAFHNSDNTGHNVYSPDGEKYDLGTWHKGEVRKYTFKREGVYTQLCKMHPSMLAYIVVLQNRYWAVTGDDGTFTIKNVPPGSYAVKVWHERRKAPPQKVKVSAGGKAAVSFKMRR